VTVLRVIAATEPRTRPTISTAKISTMTTRLWPVSARCADGRRGHSCGLTASSTAAPGENTATVIHGGNATIYVSDMQRSVGFYTRALGLRLVYRAAEHWAQLDYFLDGICSSYYTARFWGQER
jgi:hypothetical protein